MTDKKGIGLLGGTFDPVHRGHISIAESFLDSGYLKELWIILTPDPPHKQHRAVAGFDRRFELLTTAFDEYEHVSICDIERKLPKPSYTVHTLAHLNDKFPREKFYLCIGEDSLADFKSWHKWRDILNYCNLLVAERPNGHARVNSLIEDHTIFIQHDPVEISSTEIRRRLAAGERINEFVPRNVEKLIREHGLYQ